jgi:hypothetical protein
MNMAIHHLDKPHRPLQPLLDFNDNQNRQGRVVVHEDSLCTPLTMHLTFRMGTE